MVFLARSSLEPQRFEASALISEDGLMIASALPHHIDELRVAGISSTLLSLGQRTRPSCSEETSSKSSFEGQRGYVVMVGAASGTMLLVLATHDARAGSHFSRHDQGRQRHL